MVVVVDSNLLQGDCVVEFDQATPEFGLLETQRPDMGLEPIETGWAHTARRRGPAVTTTGLGDLARGRRRGGQLGEQRRRWLEEGRGWRGLLETCWPVVERRCWRLCNRDHGSGSGLDRIDYPEHPSRWSCRPRRVRRPSRWRRPAWWRRRPTRWRVKARRRHASFGPMLEDQ
jgi:hypothetical protein